ncbi:MAG: 2,3,4,5-tetrahydropyridine-2,6-dicarboxylate N-acetyltransferase [Parabacteroides sp.]
MKTNYQRFLSGEYCNRLDEEVQEIIVRNRQLLAKLNAVDTPDGESRTALLHRIFGRVGKYVSIGANFHCECGKHIFMGDKVVVNMNCTFLDDNHITIGNNVLIAPNVQLYTATHPVDAAERFVEDWGEQSGDLFFRTKALPITIGDNVWIGGGAIVLPGVTIGDNCVIGAGSVVTKSVPANSVAVGNPCRVIRKLSVDRDYKFREATLDDISELKEMYKATLRTVNRADYTPEEIEDWASCGDDISHLTDLITNLYFIVALNNNNEIIGFSSIRKDGYLHAMFVHKDYQRKGVAGFLLSKVEKYAIEHHMEVITSEVSITAKPFFERKGYSVEKEQKRRANKLCLTNYWMKKVL